MRDAVRHRWGWMGLAGLMCLCLPVAAQPQASTGAGASVQVFSKVSRVVVAVGVTFALEVEVYASPASMEAAASIERAFMGAPYHAEAEGFELIREESTASGFRQDVDQPLVLVRRFMLRLGRAGLHQVPSFRFTVGGRAYATPERQVTGYAVEPGFMEAGKAIMPIVAERGHMAWKQPGFMRVGSAFLIAPDALVTSLHVILDARRVWVTLPGGKRLSVRKAWAVDPERDIALLYVDPKAVARAGLVALSLAPEAGAVTTAAKPDGEDAVAFTYGWPGGTQRSTAGLRYHGMTLQPGETLWMSANPVRPGDSGGPLLDRQGRVLGAVSAGTIGGDRPDVLRQEVCIAVDVRPVLAQKLLMPRPRSLRALMRARGFDTHPHVHALRLTTMLSAGRRHVGYKSTLDQLDAALEDSQDNARLHFLHGVIYQMLGTRHRAADAYRTSLEVFEGNFLSAYMLAQHHLRRKEYREAEDLFRRTIRYAPYTYFATYGLARTLMGRLRYEEAIPLLEVVIAYDPTFAPAYYDLAFSALALGGEPRARQLLFKLENLSPLRARQLDRVLRHPLFQPRVLEELPRASISLLPVAH